ncbi:MAG TPA: nucleotide disphospho-sugar-binding domain-containing protein [Planctomycetota bacterium]|nr:nucleotide disphospho-sugar-binding domain-containing protein [Planctomycetota bacterium]
MRIVITAIGSAGDVHPFVAVGRALHARGHEIVIHAGAWYEEAVTRAGLGFEPMDTREHYLEMTRRPELWDARRAFPFVMREAVLATLSPLYERLEAEARAGSLLVGSSLDLAGRLVQEKRGAPFVTVHVSPAILRTVHRMPVFKGTGFVGRMPRWFKRGFWWFSDRLFDPGWLPRLNGFRRRIGLPEVRRPMNGWWSSPHAILGLWPDWFAPVQPDWPPRLRLTGFPYYDRGFGGALDAELADWLDAGGPPVVFTHGSANVQGERFFRESLGACERLGMRAILVTANRADVPERLPAGVRHESYVPFGLLLPRAAALVSHGGIGTVAQGLRAGIPQLVVAMAHDQHDNGSRLEDLGAGRCVDAGEYSAQCGASLLREVLQDGRTAGGAVACASRIGRAESADVAAGAILDVASAT